MSILNFAQEAANVPSTSRRGGNTAQQADRPQAKVWLNVGYHVTVTNEAGVEEQKFVNLPLGIAIDTMEKLSPGNTQSKDWAMLTAARNELLKTLQDAGDSLADGEDRVVNLTLVLRKTAKTVDVSNETNPFSMDKANLFG